MHTAEPLVPEPSSFKVEVAIEKLKVFKSPGTDQILAELIQAGCNTLCSEIHKLINSVWKRKKSIIVPIHKKSDKNDCSSYTMVSIFHCCRNLRFVPAVL
jgi:hypothetical protein